MLQFQQIYSVYYLQYICQLSTIQYFHKLCLRAVLFLSITPHHVVFLHFPIPRATEPKTVSCHHPSPHTHTRRAMVGHSICMILCTIVYICHLFFFGCCLLLHFYCCWMTISYHLVVVASLFCLLFGCANVLENNMNKSALQI